MQVLNQPMILFGSSRVDLEEAPQHAPLLIFAETEACPLIFAETGHLTVCGVPRRRCFSP